MSRLTSFGAFVALLHLSGGVAAAQSVSYEAPGLRAYVREVLNRNSGYRAATDQLAATTEEIPPAGALPDPMVTLGVMSVPIPSFDFPREPMTQIPVMVQQRFPFPGKQGASTAVARADSAVSDEMRGMARATLAVTAAQAYYDLAYARTALTVWAQRLQLAEQAVRASQARYETGVAPQTDLLRAQLRRLVLAQDQWQLDAGIVAALARVDALRGGPSDSLPTPLLITPQGRPGFPVAVDTLPSDTVLTRQLGEQSPALRVANAQVERADRRARLFDIAARPDFTLSVQYGERFAGREPFLTTLIGLSIPIWGGRKQGPAARAARLGSDADRHHRDDLLAQLTGDLRSRAAEIHALQEQIGQTADDILPLAEATTASALQRYEVGAVEFTTVLDTQDELFRAQLRLARLIADYGAARARLAALVGEEWYQ